jgi:peptidoglycan/LPS O-acetylase OafA/YrhL
VRYCSESRLRNIAITIICLSPILRFYLLRQHFDVYPNTFCRLDGLMAGALLAILFRSRNFSPTRYVLVAWAGLLIGLPAALFTAHRVPWAVYSFTALASLCLVYLALLSQPKWFQAVLANRFLIYTGTISYGIYILEKIAPDTAQSLHLGQHPALVLPLTAITTYLLATLSWNFLEKPCLGLKRFFVVRKSTKAKVENAMAGAA